MHEFGADGNVSMEQLFNDVLELERKLLESEIIKGERSATAVMSLAATLGALSRGLEPYMQTCAAASGDWELLGIFQQAQSSLINWSRLSIKLLSLATDHRDMVKTADAMQEHLKKAIEAETKIDPESEKFSSLLDSLFNGDPPKSDPPSDNTDT